MQTLLPVTDNCLSWISGRERMTAEMISWSISIKIMWPSWDLDLWPLDLQSDVLWTAIENSWPETLRTPSLIFIQRSIVYLFCDLLLWRFVTFNRRFKFRCQVIIYFDWLSLFPRTFTGLRLGTFAACGGTWNSTRCFCGQSVTNQNCHHRSR